MSQGGYCALRVAPRYPERVRALVLMSTHVTTDEEDIRSGHLQVRGLWGNPAVPVGCQWKLKGSPQGL
jgi:3-oxoadipate enol-lactonase